MSILYAALAALLVGFSGGYMVEKWHSQDTMEALQKADATDRANGEAVIAKTLQSQLMAAQTVSQNNSQTIQRLQSENATIAADRDANLNLARRLLSNAAQSSATSHQLSETPSGPHTPPSSGTSSNESTARLLADAGDECERNADRLDSLIAEIKPQL